MTNSQQDKRFKTLLLICLSRLWKNNILKPILFFGTIFIFYNIFNLNLIRIFKFTLWAGIFIFLYLSYQLPEIFIRIPLFILTHTFYRLKILGIENLPKNKGVLLVSNHVSYIDGLVIYAASTRKVRFVIAEDIYNKILLKPIFKITGAIPIPRKTFNKNIEKAFSKVREALSNGEVICIFSEGTLTRTGNINKFNRGFEYIVKNMNIPIVPVHLDRLWGSIYSFHKGRFFFKIPKQIPYDVTVSFGNPCDSDIKAFELRNKILDLGEAAFRYRIKEDGTISKLFINQAKKHPFKFCAIDFLEKKINYFQLFISSLIVKKTLNKQIKNKENIGILLPPSLAAIIANVSLILKGNISVNLNYTLSNNVLKKIIKTGDVNYIISSKKLIKKRNIKTNKKIIYIEDILKNILWKDKIFETIKFFMIPKKLYSKIILKENLNQNKKDPVTILFTSGSTGKSKGVMLSHENILSNIEGISNVFDLKKDDKVLGFLPFFHSFGYTATMWMPLLKGIGGIYYINPLDAKKIGEFAKKYKATIMMTTPTFLNSYIKKCEPDDFETVRILLTGAEKLKQTTANLFAKKFNIKPMEGYGATELSPVVSVNMPDYIDKKRRQKSYKPGKIGKSLPGVTVKIINVETRHKVKPGEDGLILVKGANVMLGYYKNKEATENVIRNGWYNTGDIGHIDKDGFLEITDRLSRFGKIAGEMIPLIKIESTINSILKTKERVCFILTVPDEKRGERLIVLHTKKINIDSIITKMRKRGVPNLWIPNKKDFYKIKEFPILGIGKLNLAKLKQIALEKTKS